LEFQLHQAREAYQTAQKIEDVNERRRQAATPLRDARYFAARVRTAQVITNPASTDTVAFGSTVTFRRDDGRVQKHRIVGEDEADPKAGSISLISPVATLLMGKAVGDSVHPIKSLRSLRSRSTPAPDAADVWNGRFAPNAALGRLEIQVPLCLRKLTRFGNRGMSEKCQNGSVPARAACPFDSQ
jgi:transcription elongation GreA/GreB family factor